MKLAAWRVKSLTCGRSYLFHYCCRCSVPGWTSEEGTLHSYWSLAEKPDAWQGNKTTSDIWRTDRLNILKVNHRLDLHPWTPLYPEQRFPHAIQVFEGVTAWRRRLLRVYRWLPRRFLHSQIPEHYQALEERHRPAVEHKINFESSLYTTQTFKIYNKLHWVTASADCSHE